jgi:hypothetical protein
MFLVMMVLLIIQMGGLVLSAIGRLVNLRGGFIANIAIEHIVAGG